jgi:hypothetical protein
MRLQPFLQRFRLAVAQQVHRPAGFGVDQHGAVVPAAAEREIIDLSGVDLPNCHVSAGSDVADASGAC